VTSRPSGTSGYGFITLHPVHGRRLDLTGRQVIVHKVASRRIVSIEGAAP